ncbi:hypothetical protein MCEMSEM23_03058 [Rhabdaerophilaceae bacterium]
MKAVRHAIFVSGSIGAGKTVLGRAAAEALGGAFLDGDDFSEPRKPWFCSSLRTSRAILAETMALHRAYQVVVIAYPLRCVNWIYYRRRLQECGAVVHFISLRASFAASIDPARGRKFSDAEKARIREMIAQGYGERPFSDLVLDTDRDSLEGTIATLKPQLQRLISRSAC